MDGGGVTTHQRVRHLNDHLLVRQHYRRYLDAWLQRLDRIDGVIGLVTLLFLLLFLLPLLDLLCLLFHPLLVGCLGQHLEGIGLTDEVTQSVCHHITDLHTKRVLIDECCIAQPVVDGVLLFTRLNDKGTVSLEVQSLDGGQLRMTVGEIH